jgi:hypothetical protein
MRKKEQYEHIHADDRPVTTLMEVRNDVRLHDRDPGVITVPDKRKKHALYNQGY